MAVENGINEVDYVSFGLSEDAQMQAKQDLLEVAGADARSKAELIAEGLGVSVGSVESVSESSYSPYFSYERMAVNEDSIAAGYSVPINPSDVSLDVTITLQFKIKNSFWD